MNGKIQHIDAEITRNKIESAWTSYRRKREREEGRERRREGGGGGDISQKHTFKRDNRGWRFHCQWQNICLSGWISKHNRNKQ